MSVSTYAPRGRVPGSDRSIRWTTGGGPAGHHRENHILRSATSAGVATSMGNPIQPRRIPTRFAIGPIVYEGCQFGFAARNTMLACISEGIRYIVAKPEEAHGARIREGCGVWTRAHRLGSVMTKKQYAADWLRA